MSKRITFGDLNTEILGLKGAILGAKAGLFHGGEVTEEILETLQELAIRIHDIAARLEKANAREIGTMNDKGVAIRRGLEAQPRLPVECPSGGNHQWKSVCQKCGMNISFNLDLPEVPK